MKGKVSMTQRLLLADGYNLLYRAYFAIRSLRDQQDRPTNALFGMIRTLEKLRHVWSPSHMAVVFDRGRPARRTELFPAYKGQRPSMPDDLRVQIEPVKTYVELAGLRVIEREGVEADDLMAAVGLQAAAAGVPALLVTSDKDLLQMVQPSLQVVLPKEVERALQPADVERMTGVAPGQVLEWLALVGDSADNIPGVPGVGPKTAARLLQQFGRLSALYLHLDDVASERIREALRLARPEVERNLELMRLDIADEYDVDWRQLTCQSPRVGELIAFFETYGMHKLAQGLEQPELFT